MATDTLQIFGTQYTGVPGIKATDSNSQIKTYIRPQGTKSITSNGTSIDVTQYAAVDVAVPSSGGNVQSSKDYTVSASGSATISPDTGYDAMQTVALTTPAGTVTAPSTISGSSATVSTSSNTLTLSKTVSVTPSVTTAGYVTTGTAGNATVTLSATATINPTLTASGATVTAPAGYYTADATKSVSSMTLPTAATSSATSGYTSKATISRSTSDQYINIPTGYNSAGAYYKISATPNGSVTGPTSLSGSSATVSTGTNTLTLTKTGVTTTPTVSAGYVSSATASTAAVTLTADVTTKAAATITPTTTNQTIASGTYLTGTQTIAGDANLVAGNIKKNVTIFNTTGTYEGSGGGSGIQLDSMTKTLTSAASSIQFTGLSGDPTSFVITSSSNLATGASPYKTAAVVFDGTNVIGQYITNTSNAQMTYSDSAFTKSYSNGTLTVTGTGTNFQANEYKLVYTYNGSSANIDTKQVQVGSGATSITFTGLEDEPMYWSCIFTSNIGTSSGYTRAHVVVDDGSSIYGMEMGSGSSATTNWTASYSNGSLTITSSSTSAGGYFHQPGYYQLTYAYGGTIEIETEPLSVTQNGTYTAPRGKAYTPVTVNVSGSGGASIATATMTNSSNQNTSIAFTLPSGRTPKAFFARLTSQIARSSNSRYYYVFDMRWDGSSTGGVAGNQFYMYNGTLSNVTSGYSYSQSGTTFTLTTSGSRSAAPGSFYNGDYELVYVY